MSKILLLVYLWYFVSVVQAQIVTSADARCGDNKLSGFVISPYFGEQEMSFVYPPGINIRINAPSIVEFDRNKPTKLVLYALPNGNSIDWTVGKLPAYEDDWHYHIQHIGAQTRYIRAKVQEYNLVTVYLEADTKSWGKWRRDGVGREQKIKEVVEYIFALFSEYHPTIELNSHSGGGNFIFGFMDTVFDIPIYVKKISFIDSNYNWNDKQYGEKLKKWLEASPENSLFVACYDDENALLDGKSIVSRKGGTWYKTCLMQRYLRKNMKRFRWNKVENDSIIYFMTSNRKVQFYSRKNPERRIYHTILVERNGFIQSVFAGTEYENIGYQFMGRKVYGTYRQDSIIKPHAFRFPPRAKKNVTGSGFARQVMNMKVEERDSIVYKEIAQGNIPDLLRQPVYLTDSLQDADGKLHGVVLCVLPDFLTIGMNYDFLRIPMLPQTAQKIADLYGAILPTRKISDLIHFHSSWKFTPHPMTPDSTMVTVPIFVRHDSIIDATRLVNGRLYGLMAGHKKDIVITNRMADEPGRLFIYGWHYQDGKPIQPLSAAHSVDYVDYSHGVRLVRDEVLIDGKLYSIKRMLQHPVLYKLFSDEIGPMSVIRY